MRVLVTGGSGFIGSSIVDELVKAGHQPIVVDLKLQPWVSDRDYEQAETSVQNYKFPNDIDAVIHLAAFHIVSESTKHPQKYYDNNINSLLRVLEYQPKRLIFSSSAAVYGKGSVFTETAPTDPIHPYGRTKLWGEQILKDSGLKHLSLRYFNAAGAGENHGYVQEPKTHAIPILLDCIHHNKPFTIFGDKHETKDGTCVRDYTHVKDIARAHVLALDYEGDCQIMNIGSGEGTTLRELIDCAEQVTGKDVDWRLGEARDFDPPILVADTQLAERELKFHPSHNLADIVKDAWEWELRKPS